MDITSPTDLPGGTGSGATAVEKIFDFSMDPIPVNATDLFIQVVYRGVLGAETDGIAVGTLDIREPTYYAAWNNTDYFYNEAFPMWVGAAGNFPARAIQGIRVCAGAPSKLVYQYNINLPQPGLAFPFPGFSPPGVLRLAFLFATPVGLTRISYRSTPIMSMATPASPSAPQRPGFTTGQQRQASKEFYPESGTGALPAPSNCGVNPPAAGANVWCNDPVDKRRGLAFGAIGSPLYYTNLFSGNDAPDVDIPPALPVFTTQTMRTGGTIEFDNAVLQNCPPAPTLSAEGLRELELREAAWDLGVDLDAIEKRP